MPGRVAFTDQEAATFRGVITALSKGRGRVLARLAAASKSSPNGGGGPRSGGGG